MKFLLLKSIFLFFFFLYSSHVSSVEASSSSSSSSSSPYNYTSNHPLCSAQQKLSLLRFKQNLFSINHFDYYNHEHCFRLLGSDYESKVMSWDKNADCCRWDGVTCNPFTGDVIGLDLSCSKLFGVIDSNSSLFHLSHIKRLNIAFNDFSASRFPLEMARFSYGLTHLNLSNTRFSGRIPLEITFLPRLVSLDLSSDGSFDTPKPYLLIKTLLNLLQNSTKLTQLSLAFVNISSTLPTNLNLPSSFRLLDLKGTGLYGKLPENIFSFRNLRELDLSSNIGLAGPFPKVNLSSTVHLKLLDLSDTSLFISREIPASIGDLTSLHSLFLCDCGLEGPLPKFLRNLTNLKDLYLFSNRLNGTLPPWLFTLPLLEVISLRFNMLTGYIPPVLFSHQPLKYLSLGGNNLVGQLDVVAGGPVSHSFKRLVNLVYLELFSNTFTGVWELHTLFSSLTNLRGLDLSYSGLSVVTSNVSHYVNPNFSWLMLSYCKLTVFPEFLRFMKNLSALALAGNEIHGHIPDWAGEIGGSELVVLDLSHNFITGSFQLQWDKLIYLDLSSNQMSGPLPLSICILSELFFLDISNNSFEGVIPSCLGSLLGNKLRRVDFGSNYFSGTIPRVYGDCKYLGGLSMNRNLLEGEVPFSLLKCLSLEVLDLRDNDLHGSFPDWLGALPKLQVLVLRSNKFNGSVRISSAIEPNFPQLRVLDLAQNGFSGFLQEINFQNFRHMINVERKGKDFIKYIMANNEFRYSYYMTVVVKGLVFEHMKVLAIFTAIDLSKNRFQGEIPDVIGNLNSLVALNLSHNRLTGQVPYSLGNLQEIESLDLSCNQLEGLIPQHLADLTFLAVLNLSQNHLTGRIPQGPQFNTFKEDSFEGNTALCGFPLASCEGSQNLHPSSQQLEDVSDTDMGFTWKVVALGYSCGTLLGLVMGYLMLASGRPKWFSAIADVGEQRIRRRKTRRNRIYIGR